MGRLVCFLIFVGVAVVLAAPKVEEASFGNLIESISDVKVTSDAAESGRSFDSLENKLEQYVKTHQVSFEVPMTGSTVTLGGRNLDNDELDLTVKLNSESGIEARGKKHKIKKIFAPILVFIIIKAMTLIPLALGILGIKTWNALQLGMVAFVSAIVMAVWKICSKLNHEPPHIIHNSYDHLHHDRSDIGAQQMAYAAYAPQQ